MWGAIQERSLDQSAQRLIASMAYRAVRLNPSALLHALSRAPMEFTWEATQKPIICLPMPDGTMARFRFEESPIMEPGLAAKYPGFKTYRAQGIDDPAATSRFDWLPNGFHAIILTPAGTVLINPYSIGNTTDYVTYWKKTAAADARPFECYFDELNLPQLPKRHAALPSVHSGATLRTYRLALACTNEYAVAFGDNTIAGALAAEVSLMNRVNGIFEREVAVHMNLVADNDLIIYAGDNLNCGGPCTDTSDPYTNSNTSVMGGVENQPAIDNAIGPANYDIGHVVGTGGGGVGGGGPCSPFAKAQGASGGSDVFAFTIVAHEMGHQFGATHSYNVQAGVCTSRYPPSAYEPGSGITIMSYAGLCGQQNLGDVHTWIDIFNIGSLEQIIAFVETFGDECATRSDTSNTPPSVTGPGDFTIPRNTPFSLTASATDPDGDSITYDWEEYDLGGPATTTPNSDLDGSPRPIFRVYPPTAERTRAFPSLPFILNNANVPPTFANGFLTGELLPSISRAMVFQVVARDNRANGGGIDTATSTVTVDGNATPFAVTSPNGSISIQPLTSFDVTWNPSGNAENVTISLSIDGGNTFPIMLAENTPNDGFETVLIPDLPTGGARIKVKAVGNIYFDISDSIDITTEPIVETTVSLPTAIIDISVNPFNFTQPVMASTIDEADDLIGFQGDLTFDSTVMTFQGAPVSQAGLTGGNWNVTGNILPGTGAIRTLHLSGFSNDSTPMAGTGILFNLNMLRIGLPGASTLLSWAMPPQDFVFIDQDQNRHVPRSRPSGGITFVAPPTPTPSSTPTPTPTPGQTPFRSPTPTATPTATPIGQVEFTISGNVSYCAAPQLNPVANVTVNLTGDATISTLSDSSGNYYFGPLSSGNYTVTPSKTGFKPGSAGIDSVDVAVAQQHFLTIGAPLSGCLLAAADVNGSSEVDTVDVVAIQRFFLGLATGIANTGKYQFIPPNRSYLPLTIEQLKENYDTLVLGDVAPPFVHRPDQEPESE